MTDTAGLRIAVVGCGYWGSKHVRVLHSIDGVDEVALVDAEQSRLASLARAYPGARSFSTLRAALPHIDAVVVATPPSSHVAVALQAIDAGKHVLVEKPLAPTTGGARHLISAAARAGVTLMTGHTFEYNPAVWKLRELVQSRVLGEVYYIDSARLNLGLYQSDVNVIFDLAPHDVSIINHVLGEQPIAVDEPLSVQDKHFAECITTDATPQTDGRNGLAVVEVLEAAELSLKLDRPVRLDELAVDTDVLPLRATARVSKSRPWLRDHPGVAPSGNGWHGGHGAAVPAVQ